MKIQQLLESNSGIAAELSSLKVLAILNTLLYNVKVEITTSEREYCGYWVNAVDYVKIHDINLQRPEFIRTNLITNLKILDKGKILKNVLSALNRDSLDSEHLIAEVNEVKRIFRLLGIFGTDAFKILQYLEKLHANK